MNTFVEARNALGHKTVRLSDSDLHRVTCKAIWESNHIVFESLPGMIAQIIANKTWKSYGHKDFASYALDATSNGLGINTNQRLWVLFTCMNADGEHMKEWGNVAARVDEMVRLQAKKDGIPITYFRDNSLEKLAKSTGLTRSSEKITYLPSQSSRGSMDRDLMRLRASNMDVYRRVVSGDLSLGEARKRAGVVVTTGLSRAKSLVRNMTKPERREFIAWLKEEGYLE